MGWGYNEKMNKKRKFEKFIGIKALACGALGIK